MNDVSITIMANDVHIHTGECVIGGNAKKMQVVRFLNTNQFEILNQNEPNYWPLVWSNIGENLFQTTGVQGQTNLNPDELDVFVGGDTQGIGILRDIGYLNLNGGYAPEWKIIIREL